MSRRAVAPLLVAVLAAGLLAIGLHTAGATDEHRRVHAAGNADRGHRLFLVGCAYCHGQNGEGTAQGPDLRGVGAEGGQQAPPLNLQRVRVGPCHGRHLGGGLR